MRVTLLHNPKAGNGDDDGEALLAQLRLAGYEPAYQSTKDDDWPAALVWPAELVIATGGDGTITKVMKECDGSVPLAILPRGTANNIAGSLGIRAKPQALIEQWREAKARPFDLWRARGPWGTRSVVESCGFGTVTLATAALHARHARGADRDEKLAIARAIVLEQARVQAPFELHAKCDGQTVEGPFLLFEMANAGLAGPRLPIAPQADPTDGWLDIVLVRETQRDDLVGWLHDGARAEANPFPALRCRRVEFHTKGAAVRLGDGAYWPEHAERGKADACNGAIEHARTIPVLVPRAAG